MNKTMKKEPREIHKSPVPEGCATIAQCFNLKNAHRISEFRRMLGKSYFFMRADLQNLIFFLSPVLEDAAFESAALPPRKSYGDDNLWAVAAHCDFRAWSVLP